MGIVIQVRKVNFVEEFYLSDKLGGNKKSEFTTRSLIIFDFFRLLGMSVAILLKHDDRLEGSRWIF